MLTMPCKCTVVDPVYSGVYMSSTPPSMAGSVRKASFAGGMDVVFDAEPVGWVCHVLRPPALSDLRSRFKGRGKLRLATRPKGRIPPPSGQRNAPLPRATSSGTLQPLRRGNPAFVHFYLYHSRSIGSADGDGATHPRPEGCGLGKGVGESCDHAQIAVWFFLLPY